MTIYRGTVLDTPDSPFTGGVLRAEADAGVAVTDGVITDRGPFGDHTVGDRKSTRLNSSH